MRSGVDVIGVDVRLLGIDAGKERQTLQQKHREGLHSALSGSNLSGVDRFLLAVM